MRRYVLSGVAMGLGLLAVADALAIRAGWGPGLFPRSTGPGPWLTSRAAGITAFVALSLDVIFGMLVSTGAADRWIARARTVDVHRWLSGVALTLVATHALLLLGDGFVRFDLLDVLVPFVAPYRAAAVALGVLAAYLGVVIHLGFEMRHRIGVAAWKRLHRLSLAVFVLAVGHGLLAGTDADAAWMRHLYLASGGTVGGLLLLRGLTAWHDRLRPRRLAAR